MDSSVAPKPHPKLVWTAIVLVVIAVIVGVVYVLMLHGYLGFNKAGSGQPDIVWTTKTKDGSTWDELAGMGGTPVTRADLPGTTIVSVAGGGGNAFVLAMNQDRSSTVYPY